MTFSSIFAPRLLLTIGFLSILAACEDKAATPTPPRTARVVEIDPQDTSLSAEASGQIQARYTSNVGFLVGGRLISRDVDLGAMVKAGDLLARIDPVDFQNKQVAAQSQVSAATADVTQTSAQEERYRKLLADGYTTQADYDKALRALQNAQASLQGAQANLRLADDQLKYTQLVAPTDGAITQTGADPGQVVMSGQMIVQIAQLNEREAVFSVAPQRVGYAHVGLPIKVWLQDQPSVWVEGTVREIAPNADPVTGTYTVKISLPKAPASMRLGTIVVGRAEVNGGVMTRVPVGALLQTGDRPQVWVVSQPGNKVEKRVVSVVRYDQDAVTISDGLKKGDLVVVAGVNSLADGQAVSPQKVAVQ